MSRPFYLLLGIVAVVLAAVFLSRRWSTPPTPEQLEKDAEAAGGAAAEAAGSYADQAMAWYYGFQRGLSGGGPDSPVFGDEWSDIAAPWLSWYEYLSGEEVL